MLMCTYVTLTAFLADSAQLAGVIARRARLPWLLLGVEEIG